MCDIIDDLSDKMFLLDSKITSFHGRGIPTDDIVVKACDSKFNCPQCNNTISYFISSSNGHLSIRCSICQLNYHGGDPVGSTNGDDDENKK